MRTSWFLLYLAAAGVMVWAVWRAAWLSWVMAMGVMAVSLRKARGEP